KTLLSSYCGEGDFSTTFDYNLIRGENWNSLWESNFNPIVVDRLCTIKASFHHGLPKTRFNITIDPKMAFGTGHHQTTHLMVKGLMNEAVKGKSVLDMGCGTAILSILAAKMGASSPVISIDIDPIAVDSAIENGKRNRVSSKLKVFEGDSSILKKGEFDLVLANINRNIIIADIQKYSDSLRPEGTMLLSGFYFKEKELIAEAGAKAGLAFVSCDTLDDWALVKLRKLKKGETVL
ncbi:MAG TPA: 50S ribosomal protein L11 methyltransferase, partial [Bacteroidales bacterium]|nr:50S ribosomal protein L11 methyltransferase [Bacteroidales bacterium]